jgi:hypothetical protein
MRNEQEPQITATKTPGGWHIEMNDVAWEVLLEAVTEAVSSALRESDPLGLRTIPFRKLRAALNHAEQRAGGEEQEDE